MRKKLHLINSSNNSFHPQAESDPSLRIKPVPPTIKIRGIDLHETWNRYQTFLPVEFFFVNDEKIVITPSLSCKQWDSARFYFLTNLSVTKSCNELFKTVLCPGSHTCMVGNYFRRIGQYDFIVTWRLSDKNGKTYIWKGTKYDYTRWIISPLFWLHMDYLTKACVSLSNPIVFLGVPVLIPQNKSDEKKSTKPELTIYIDKERESTDSTPIFVIKKSIAKLIKY